MNAYAAAVASHVVTDQKDPKTGRVLCACGKPMSYRHIAAIGSHAARKAGNA